MLPNNSSSGSSSNSSSSITGNKRPAETQLTPKIVEEEENCPICLDPLETKEVKTLDKILDENGKEVCGHSFHKKCLFIAYETKRKTNPYCILHCPLCRSKMGHEIKDVSYRYKLLNNLDILENFWIKKEFMCCDI